jgi:hypothetical protein
MDITQIIVTTCVALLLVGLISMAILLVLISRHKEKKPTLAAYKTNNEKVAVIRNHVRNINNIKEYEGYNTTVKLDAIEFYMIILLNLLPDSVLSIYTELGDRTVRVSRVTGKHDLHIDQIEKHFHFL